MVLTGYLHDANDCCAVDGTTATQINKVITHPTLPLLVTAHEDKYIRMFDLDTGEQPLRTMFRCDILADTKHLNVFLKVLARSRCSLIWTPSHPSISILLA